MSTRRFYSGPLSMFGAKAEIALREKRADFELVMVPFDDEDRYRPKHPDVVRINPKGQVPVLIDGEAEIFDSTQIFEYLEDAFPEPPLWPADRLDRARARLLEVRADEVVFANILRLFPLQDRPDHPDAVAARATAAAHYGEMDALLRDREYLAGPYGYADIALFMVQLFGERKGAVVTGATPRLLAWRRRVLARPAVRIVAGRMGAWLMAQNRPVPDFLTEAAAEADPE